MILEVSPNRSRRSALRSSVMPYEMFTPEWAVAWGRQINESDAYRLAAQTWKWPVVLTMKEAPALGVPERSIYLDLLKGECREARSAAPEDLEETPFVLTADPKTWKQVLDGELDPIPGIMRGRIRLIRGSLATLLPYVLAAKELVSAAARVETCFPEGLT